jgi:UDP-N-acetyl-D-mannosaminuronic acid dehydrogenase
MLTDAAGVDYSRVLQAMKMNYPRAQDIPSAGFAAGPCLLKDTMQLSAFADNTFSLGHTAMLINEGLVSYIVDKLAQKYTLANTTVGILGMAFKADSDDTRASLSYKLKKLLWFRCEEVLTTDPYVTTDPEVLPLDTVVERSDVLLLAVPHSAYGDLRLDRKPIIDVWNHLGQGSLI